MPLFLILTHSNLQLHTEANAHTAFHTARNSEPGSNKLGRSVIDFFTSYTKELA
jgi:hypothetical protein